LELVSYFWSCLGLNILVLFPLLVATVVTVYIHCRVSVAAAVIAVSRLSSFCQQTVLCVTVSITHAAYQQLAPAAAATRITGCTPQGYAAATSISRYCCFMGWQQLIKQPAYAVHCYVCDQRNVVIGQEQSCEEHRAS